MKQSGIIRRIDDLGRVVIPREIRRTLRIREGDPLEIILDQNGVYLERYSPLGKLPDTKFVTEFLYELTGQLVMITDRDIVIAQFPGEEFIGKSISLEIDQIIFSGEKVIVDRDISSIAGDCQVAPKIVVPILAMGDPVGAIILSGKTGMDTAEVAANFLSRQLEKE